jgi:hypothetical protein
MDPSGKPWIGVMRGMASMTAMPVQRKKVTESIIRVSERSTPGGNVTITAVIEGKAPYLSIRNSNLTVKNPLKNVNLQQGKKITLRWQAK